MTAEFYGHGYEQSSDPTTIVQVHEADIWPVHDNSGSGAKDQIGIGLHPVVAIGGRTAAAGRPLNVTGVVISFTAGLTIPTGLVRINTADGVIVRNYVANILTYGISAAATFEQAPIVGQPVYVDDSADLAAGVTLSMSPLALGGARNPVAGHLWYCQDEYADAAMGGPNAAPVFVGALADELVQRVYCIKLSNGWRELAA